MQINILHISDLHLAKIPVRREILRFNALAETETYKRIWEGEMAASFNPLVLDAVSDFANKHQDLLDVILITGDISTTGNIEDLEEALAIITGNGTDTGFGKLTKNRNPVLNFPDDIPIYLLPGNHDRYHTNNLIFSPGSKNFHDIFNAFWDKDVRPNDPINKENISVGIISADFSLQNAQDCKITFDLLRGLYDAIDLKFPTPAQNIAALAQGYVEKEVLKELIEKTDEFITECEKNKKEPFIIWAIHFPPYFPSRESGITKIINEIKNEYKKLVDEDKLVSVANALGINMILAGHRHIPDYYPLGDFDVSCSGSTTQFMLDDGEIINNYCHILTIEASEGIDSYVNDFRLYKRGMTDVIFRKVEK